MVGDRAARVEEPLQAVRVVLVVGRRRRDARRRRQVSGRVPGAAPLDRPAQDARGLGRQDVRQARVEREGPAERHEANAAPHTMRRVADDRPVIAREKELRARHEAERPAVRMPRVDAVAARQALDELGVEPL